MKVTASGMPEFAVNQLWLSSDNRFVLIEEITQTRMICAYVPYPNSNLICNEEYRLNGKRRNGNSYVGYDGWDLSLFVKENATRNDLDGKYHSTWVLPYKVKLWRKNNSDPTVWRVVDSKNKDNPVSGWFTIYEEAIIECQRMNFSFLKNNPNS